MGSGPEEFIMAGVANAKPETVLNGHLMTALRWFRLDPQRIENVVGEGTPDIEFVGGWIESKFLWEWPRRPDTIIHIRHFTTEQRAWHVRRAAFGGISFVALEVEDDLLIIKGDKAARMIGNTTRGELLASAECVCHGAAVERAIEAVKCIRQYVVPVFQGRKK
jgi:hypothetical protein